jgi:hypothetical protein
MASAAWDRACAAVEAQRHAQAKTAMEAAWASAQGTAAGQGWATARRDAEEARLAAQRRTRAKAAMEAAWASAQGTAAGQGWETARRDAEEARRRQRATSDADNFLASMRPPPPPPPPHHQEASTETMKTANTPPRFFNSNEEYEEHLAPTTEMQALETDLASRNPGWTPGEISRITLFILMTRRANTHLEQSDLRHTILFKKVERELRKMGYGDYRPRPPRRGAPRRPPPPRSSRASQGGAPALEN